MRAGAGLAAWVQPLLIAALAGPPVVIGASPVTMAASAGAPEVAPDSLVHAPTAATVADVRARFGPQFRVLDTDHFRLVSDTSPRAHRVIAAQLEQFYRTVHPRLFHNEMPRLTVCLVHGGADYERFMIAHHHAEEARIYGVYIAAQHTVFARRCFPDGSSAGLGTVFHETGHAMIQADFGRRPVPSWFGEGLASLFERGRVVRGRWTYGNPNPMRETLLRRAWDAHQVPTLAEYMEQSDEAFVRHGSLAYAVGRSFFLYLLRSHGEDAIRRFVAAMRAGTSPVRALGAEWTTDRLETEWRRSIVEINFGGDYLYRADGPHALEILEQGAARHPGYGNLQAELARELSRVKRMDEAVAHAQAALRDPRCTEGPLAWSTIGYALWTRNSWTTRLAFRTALRYQPWNEEVMDYEYDHLARLTEAAGDRTTAARLRAELAGLKADSQPSGCANEAAGVR